MLAGPCHGDSFSRLRGKGPGRAEGGSNKRYAYMQSPREKGTRPLGRMPLCVVDYGFTGFNWVRMYFEFDQLLTMLA